MALAWVLRRRPLPKTSKIITHSVDPAVSVFGIYELLDNIFYFVYEDYNDSMSNDGRRRESAGFLLVNRLWFRVAVRHVWRHCGRHTSPSRDDLATLMNYPERFQTYANFVRRLELSCEIRGYMTYEEEENRLRLGELLEDGGLPQLNELSLCSSQSLWTDQAYLQRTLKSSKNFNNLKSLKTTVVGFTPEFWTLLKDRSPYIEELWLDSTNLNDHAAVKAFQDFLRSLTKLKIISFDRSYCQDIVGTLECLAEKSTLTELWLGDKFDLRPAQAIGASMNAISAPFASLEDLTFSITHEGFAYLVPYFGNLKRLSVDFKPDGTYGTYETDFSEVCFKVDCRLPSLRFLRVNLGFDDILDGGELLKLAGNCPQLTSIGIELETLMSCHGISDSVIGAFVQLLPDLEDFRLAGDCVGPSELGGVPALTEQALLHFGRNCKALKALTIPVEPNFRKWVDDGEAGIFPMLRNLELNHISNRPVIFWANSLEGFQGHPNRIAQMMPKLEYFDTKGMMVKLSQPEEYYLDDAIKSVVQARRDQDRNTTITNPFQRSSTSTSSLSHPSSPPTSNLSVLRRCRASMARWLGKFQSMIWRPSRRMDDKDERKKERK